MDGSIDLVIFDCDGVLIDSELLVVEVKVRVLAELGWPLTREEVVARFVGRSSEFMRREIEAQLGRCLPDDWEAPFQSLYRQAWTRSLRPVEGILEALERIGPMRDCVASNATHEQLRFTLGLVGLYERFEGRIFSLEDVQRGKPAPDLFLHAAAQLGVEPGRCVVVEDSPYGVQAARAAGMRVLAFAGGLTPAASLAGTDIVVFEHMRQLPTLLGAIS